MRVEFRITGKRALVGQKLTKLRNTIRGGKIQSDIVKKGYNYAYKNAPVAKDSLGGGTRDAIRIKKTKKTTSLELLQPTKRPPGKGGYRPYHMWMHGIGKHRIGPYIRTGDPNFMENAFDVMRDYGQDRMRKLIKSN